MQKSARGGDRFGPDHAFSGMTALERVATLEELEETARLMLLQPNTPPLRATNLDDLRQTFGAHW